MKWNEEFLNKIEPEITNIEAKKKLAEKIAKKVKNGQVIGFGSGTTSYLATIAISEKIKKEGIKIKAIPTSFEISMLCGYLEIATTNLLEDKPDWCFDGADEVDSNNWLIKGRGGAMFKEKLNMLNSPNTYILIDKNKEVSKLGDKFKVPVECFPNSINYVKQELIKIGGNDISLREAKGKDGPIVTENGNFILDVRFKNITEKLEKQIKEITGVIESGLFIGYNVEIIKNDN